MVGRAQLMLDGWRNMRAGGPGGDRDGDGRCDGTGAADVGSADVGSADAGAADVGAADVGSADVGSAGLG